MANIIESRVTLEDEVFEETIETMEEPIEVVRPTSYEDLEDLPQVNGVTLIGNKTSEELGIVTATDIENAVSAEATLRENADTTLGGRIDGEITNRTNADNALGTRIDNEILARQGGDNNLQTQIDAITSKSDVVDVVADYASLQAYDTQHLGNNDVIKVLDDETHDDAQTYYRWNKTAGTWSYIGSEAPYYSKGQMDTMLQAKQDKLIAGANIQIAQDGKTISATDTTYTAGNGLNLNGTEFSADTTVLATKSDLDNYYTKTETDTKLAPKLEAELVAELPPTGTEGKLYLTPKAHTTQTATGNPITATVTEDAGAIESFQLDGDTFQQSYEGKNLFNFVSRGTAQGLTATYDTATGAITVTGKATTNYSNISGAVNLALEAGQTFTSSIDIELPVRAVTRVIYTDDTEESFNIEPGQTSVTWSPSKQVKQVRLYISLTVSETSYDLSFKFQIEAGSTTATSYEPFVGGQPSPSPEYPQPIQTVTGEQTVTINSTNYPISLGSLELCKLGTYQDYIYKDGDSWKVHKDIGKYTFVGTEDWTWDDSIPRLFYGSGVLANLGVHSSMPTSTSTLPTAAVNKFTGKTFNDFYTNQQSNGFAMSTLGKNWNFGDKSWTSSNDAVADVIGTTVYYALLSAYKTDTVITDTALIAQLEVIRTAALENGANTITNTATGSNLAGDMEIGYYGYNPRNRYDKWLWLDINNEYEQIGS